MALFGGGNLEEYRNTTAVTRSDLTIMAMDQEEFVLAPFAIPYDYLSYPPLHLRTLDETEIKSKKENVHKLMLSSWIDYVAGNSIGIVEYHLLEDEDVYFLQLVVKNWRVFDWKKLFKHFHFDECNSCLLFFLSYLQIVVLLALF